MERSEKTSSATTEFGLEHLASCPEQLLPVFSLEFRRASHRETDDEVAQSVNSSPGFLPYYRNITESILGTLGPNDIIGLHNVLKHDVRDLVERLNANLVQGEDKWAYTGVGRRKDESSVLYSPILYRPSRWQHLNLTAFSGAATPELGSPSQDTFDRAAFTQSWLVHRQTGACVTAVNNYFGRIHTAGAFQLVAPVLGEPSALSTRNRLLKIREESCPELSAGDTDFESMEDICQYLTEYFIPFYDSIVAKPFDEEWEERDVFS